MNQDAKHGLLLYPDADDPDTQEERRKIQRRQILNAFQNPPIELNQHENLLTDPTDESVLTFTQTERTLAKRDLDTDRPVVLANAEALVGHVLQTEVDSKPENYQSERLETETYGLLLPAGFTAVEKVKYRNENNEYTKPQHEQKMVYDMKGYKQKERKWYNFWNCFLERRKRKVAPLPMVAIVDNVLTREETSSERARRNWLKARYLWNLEKMTKALSIALDDRDDKISRGKTSKDLNSKLKRKTTLWKYLKYSYINPNSTWYLVWSCLLQILFVYYILVAPYTFVFRIEDTHIIIMNYIVDGIYLADIIMRFFVALQSDQTGDLIFNKKKIARNYLKSTLIFDVLAIIPWQLFEKILLVLKFLRIMRLGPILKLIDLICDKITPWFVEGSKTLRVSAFISDFISLLLILVVVFHFGACLWIEVGYPDGRGDKTWFASLASYEPGILPKDYSGGSVNTYVASIFQIITTLTTVGYGDFAGHTVPEYFVLMAVEFFGIMFFGYLIHRLKYTIMSLEEAQIKERQKIEDLENWLFTIERMIMDLRGVINHKLLDKTNMILKYSNMDNLSDLFIHNDFYKALPLPQKQIVSKLTFSPMKSFFSVFFDHLSEAFSMDLLLHAEPKIYLPGESVIERGKYPLGIFLILEGEILITSSNQYQSFRCLNPGSFFGELSITTERCSTLSFIAKTPARFLLLRKAAVEEVGKKYPKDLKAIKSLAFYRHKYFLHAKKVKKEGLGGGDPETYFSLYNPIRQLSDSRFTETTSSAFVFKKITQDALAKHREKDKVPQKANTATIQPPDTPDTVSSPENQFLNVKPKTLPPLTKDELAKILKPSTFANLLNAIPKLHDSDVETVPSEHSEESGNEDNEDDEDDIYSDGSDLNYSDVYPLESFEMMFKEPSGGEQVVTYLEEQITFYNQKLDQLQRQVKTEADFYARQLHNKVKEDLGDVQ